MRYLRLLLAACLGTATLSTTALRAQEVHYVPLRLAAAAPANLPGKNASALPPPAERKVDYVTDIHPILRTSCASCHLSGNKKGGFQLDTRELILKGGIEGPAVVVGDSGKSLLIKMVAALDPDNMMPPAGPPLPKAQVALLRAWIDQGMDFGKAAVATPTFYRAPLAPRRPSLPAAAAVANPIDRMLLPYFKAHNVTPKPVVDDRTYARRVYLDIIGLLPTPGQLQEFLDDKRPDKRAQLARQLLGDNKQYAVHWLSFWNDALRNDYAGTGYIDSGRQQITQWLYNALKTNLRYDTFVAQLVNPVPESQGFVKGIVWRGTVNASQTPQMQAAQNISQVFLGINLKCASCHDSFISDWKLTDSYGMAGIYADAPLGMVRCDIPSKKIAPVKFLYPELGAIDPAAPRATRLKQLADAITSPRDGRLSRTMVNRLWARLMGRGLVEPADEMDNPPWNADLLDWLASDFADSGYDVKHVLETIVTSRAYQLPTMTNATDRSPNFVFAGPLVRRLSAEQFADAVAQVTGVWPQTPAVNLQGSDAKLHAQWIWNDPKALTGTDGGSIYLRKVVEWPDKPAQAVAVVTCDNEFVLYVNGKQAASGDDWQKPVPVDLTPYLVAGRNVIAVQAINWPDKVNGKGVQFSSPNPAGFVFAARIHKHAGDPPTAVEDLGSDATWLCSSTQQPGWERPEFAATGWQPVVELADANSKRYTGPGPLLAALEQNEAHEHVRAALTKADTLAVALGRPNREQVVTTRASIATTLQALELTNGRTLAQILQQGAQGWVARHPNSGRDLVTDLYVQSLGRQPTAAELAAAVTVVGATPQTEGVQDLLWIVTMLPDFQLIY